MLNQEQPTVEEVTQHIKAMRDSVWVIKEAATADPVTQDISNTIKRNVEHLELMMAKDFIINSGDDLSDVTASIALGKTKIIVTG